MLQLFKKEGWIETRVKEQNFNYVRCMMYDVRCGGSNIYDVRFTMYDLG
jgi:hypothetical protein